jgi:hypothetical protein
MSPEARDRSFDELTRGLASGNVSRRKALKWMGRVLLGGTVLASIPGVAIAAPPPGRGRPAGSAGCPVPGQIRVGGVCQCPTGQEICGGRCVTSCGSGQQLNPTTCTCECVVGSNYCQSVEGCGGGGAFCRELLDGSGTVCTSGVHSCIGGATAPTCADCAQFPGSVCVKPLPDSGCPQGQCAQPCP